MITAVIQNGRQTAAIELPRDWCSLQYWLAQIDIREQPEHIPIGFDSDKAISVTLAAKSDIGKALTALFTEKNTLGEANVCTHMTENARMEIREELEQGLLYEQYTSPQEVMDSIRSMTGELVTVTADYYCSLKFQMTDEEYGDWYEVDNGYGIATEETSPNFTGESMTLEEFMRDQSPQEGEVMRLEGTISRLKNHIDKIVETGTNPAYGIPSDSVTYKVVQITIDGDIAFAVIYGG